MNLDFIKCILIPNQITRFTSYPSYEYIRNNVDRFRILIYPIYKNYFRDNFLCLEDNMLYLSNDKEKKYTDISQLQNIVNITHNSNHVLFSFDNFITLKVTYEAYSYFNIVIKNDSIRLSDLTTEDIIGITKIASRMGLISDSMHLVGNTSSDIFNFQKNNFRALDDDIQLRIFNIWLKRKNCLLTGGTGIGKTTQIPKLFYWFNYLFDGYEQFGSVCNYDYKNYIFNKKLKRSNTILSLPRKELIRRTIESISVSMGFKEINGSPLLAKFKDIDMEIKYRNDDYKKYFNNFIISVNKLSIDLIKTCNTIIIDEIHEHDVNSDIAISIYYLKKKIYNIRNVIMMSATVESDMRYINMFFKKDIEIVNLEGILPYKITELYLPKHNMVDVVYNNLPDAGYCSLVFFETINKINAMYDILHNDKRFNSKIIIYKIHSKEPDYTSLINFIQKDKTRSSIILCTNILESSITISNVTIVIDNGLFYIKKFMDGEILYITKDMAHQRRGRVGRTMAGTYIMLYDKENLLDTVNYTDYRYLDGYIITFSYYDIDVEKGFFLPPSDMSRINNTINYLKYRHIDIYNNIKKIYRIYRTQYCNMIEYISLYLTVNSGLYNELSLYDSGKIQFNAISRELRMVLISMDVKCEAINVLYYKKYASYITILKLKVKHDVRDVFKYNDKIDNKKSIFLVNTNPTTLYIK